MAAMFMIAIEATIVSTAMPKIAAQLGDLHFYAWVFSSFLLTQTATTVVFGKLSDLYGRRPVLLAGIAIFLAGSLLCGFATSIPMLILFRLVQGVGAGAIQPIGITLVGDLYTAQERGRIQGWLASVWGVSSVLGPLAGALIVKQVSWAWIFWINLPIGAVAAVGFVLFLHEGVERRRRTVDVAGAALFTVAIASLMMALTELGTSEAGTLWPGLVFLVASVLFVLQERRAADPMLDLRLWAQRPILTSNATTLLSGMAIIGLTTFLPIFVHGVMGQSLLVAGFTLTMMVFGWPIGATLAARNFVRFGLRPTLLFGAVLMPLGAVAFVVLGASSSPVVAGLGSTVMGFGMGFPVHRRDRHHPGLGRLGAARLGHGLQHLLAQPGLDAGRDGAGHGAELRAGPSGRGPAGQLRPAPAPAGRSGQPRRLRRGRAGRARAVAARHLLGHLRHRGADPAPGAARAARDAERGPSRARRGIGPARRPVQIAPPMPYPGGALMRRERAA